MVQRRGFQKLLVANRGEVAGRIGRTCDLMGITPVFAVSEADAEAPYTKNRETVCIGPARSAESYLAVERVVQAAVQTQCTALHPGWGFLSENPLLPSLCRTYGVTFVGPPAHVIALMGTKSPAKSAMAKAGLQLIPGSDGPVATVKGAQSVCKSIGFPVLVKAECGGGGRGMRIARSEGEVETAFLEAKRESQAAFGDARVYIEKLIERGRHIEIQVLADTHGNAIHLGERDCTVQRNHQKLIEESPSPVLSPAERQKTLDAAVRATKSIGYVGAGTFEFLLDDEGVLRFMEMNTRLQVEHSITEMRSGVDLVAEQIKIAEGQVLSISQGDVVLKGHSIECRINAEDPSKNFAPNPGKIEKWQTPTSEHLRIDTHVESGYTVPPHYDSLIAKIIAYGEDRDVAIKNLLEALKKTECNGIETTIPMHIAVLASKEFQESRYFAGEIPGWSQSKSEAGGKA